MSTDANDARPSADVEDAARTVEGYRNHGHFALSWFSTAAFAFLMLTVVSVISGRDSILAWMSPTSLRTTALWAGLMVLLSAPVAQAVTGTRFGRGRLRAIGAAFVAALGLTMACALVALLAFSAWRPSLLTGP